MLYYHLLYCKNSVQCKCRPFTTKVANLKYCISWYSKNPRPAHTSSTSQTCVPWHNHVRMAIILVLFFHDHRRKRHWQRIDPEGTTLRIGRRFRPPLICPRSCSWNAEHRIQDTSMDCSSIMAKYIRTFVGTLKNSQTIFGSRSFEFFFFIPWYFITIGIKSS